MRSASAVGPDEAVAYLPTCNFVVRRDVLLAVGGFAADMRLGEDVDFTWRVLRTGASACYAPAGRVTHHHRERLGPLLRRRADYGSSEADLQRRHPAGRRVMPMPRVEPPAAGGAHGPAAGVAGRDRAGGADRERC